MLRSVLKGARFEVSTHVSRRWVVLAATLLGLVVFTAGCIAESEGSTLRRRSVTRAPARPAAADAPVRTAEPEQAAAPAAVGGGLRLIAWNMEWLDNEPGHGTVKRSVADYQAFAGYAAAIDPDIAVLEEIDGERAVQRVFDSTRYNIYVTRESGVQRVALVWKKGVDLKVVDEVEELGPGGLRESPDALVTTAGGSFRLLGVHLKSSCFSDNLQTTRKDACLTLRGQMGIVEAWAEARYAEGMPFVILGDFNRRFSERDDAWADLNDGLPAGLMLLAPTIGKRAHCRDGRYRDYIDHIVLSSSLAARMIPGSFQQWNYRSWDPPRLSDHCPIGLDLR